MHIIFEKSSPHNNNIYILVLLLVYILVPRCTTPSAAIGRGEGGIMTRLGSGGGVGGLSR